MLKCGDEVAASNHRIKESPSRLGADIRRGVGVSLRSRSCEAQVVAGHGNARYSMAKCWLCFSNAKSEFGWYRVCIGTRPETIGMGVIFLPARPNARGKKTKKGKTL